MISQGLDLAEALEEVSEMRPVLPAVASGHSTKVVQVGRGFPMVAIEVHALRLREISEVRLVHTNETPERRRMLLQQGRGPPHGAPP